MAGTAMGLLCILLGGVVFYGVVARKLGFASVWSGEVAVYLMIFITLVGAGFAERERSHTHVEILVEQLPRRGQLILYLIWSIVGLATALIVAYLGALSALDAFDFGRRSVTALRVPLWIIDIAVPLGMILLAGQCGVRIGELVAELRRPPADKATR
jgi:TRAP-type C4-dicarboxylate transport system permease small subunit